MDKWFNDGFLVLSESECQDGSQTVTLFVIVAVSATNLCSARIFNEELKQNQQNQIILSLLHRGENDKNRDLFKTFLQNPRVIAYKVATTENNTPGSNTSSFHGHQGW